MLLHLGFHRIDIEVANGDDGHQVRAVPALVVLPQVLCRRVLDDLREADGTAAGVEGGAEQQLEQIVLKPGPESLIEAPLLQDHATLEVHFFRIVGYSVGPVAQDPECGLGYLGVVGWNLQPVRRVIEAGLGVHVRAEDVPDGFQILHYLLLGEALRTVECHVLNEVRQSLLGVLFMDGASLDDQCDLRPVSRLLIVPDVVAQAVGQGAADHQRIEGQRHVRVGGSWGLRGWSACGFGGCGRRRCPGRSGRPSWRGRWRRRGCGCRDESRSRGRRRGRRGCWGRRCRRRGFGVARYQRSQHQRDADSDKC